MRRAWIAAVVLSRACGGGGGPTKQQIEDDLRDRVPNYVTAACGCMGMPTLVAIKRADSSSAVVTLSVGGLMCPEATCDARVRYDYVRENGRWAMAMPMQSADTVVEGGR